MPLKEDTLFNCNVSDAKDHGIYSMCTMVLKLRNMYKWEHHLEPWEEPEPADLLDWIDAKEQAWEKMTDLEYRPIHMGETEYSPSAVEQINQAIHTENLVYGAGHGRSWKAVFFLAEMLEEYDVEGLKVQILGREHAREMSSPFAMAHNGVITIRRDSLRFFLWDQIQELSSSCRASFSHALKKYGIMVDGKIDQKKFRDTLDTMVDKELNLFIYHEVGEMQQNRLDSATLEKMLVRFPGSAIELACRTIKDVLADSHQNGLLAYCIRERQETSLSFYIGFLDGLRKMLFPEIFSAWDDFLKSKDWHLIENARQACQEKNGRIADKIRDISEEMVDLSDDEVESRFNEQILEPLGIKMPATEHS